MSSIGLLNMLIYADYQLQLADAPSLESDSIYSILLIETLGWTLQAR